MENYWKRILEAKEEFTTNYYMNEQEYIDSDIDRQIAEELANEEYEEMEVNKYEYITK